MKTKIFLSIAFLIANIVSQNVFCQQAQLTVTQVIGFPVLPADTAKEGNQYNFIVNVSNLSNNALQVFDTMRVFLKNTDTTIATIETLGYVFIDSLIGLDTFSIQVNNYQFTTNTYKVGNNIVVVWPRIGGNSGTTYDSLQIDTVYFVPLASVNMLNAQASTFSMFPNPATAEITLSKEGEKYIEYVRILNDIGQEILYRRTFEDRLDVRFLSEGFYFIEIKERNGTISRKKFLKL